MIINDVEYSVGTGVIVEVDHKSQFGCIHYFYENPSSDIYVHRRMVAVELFYKPKEISMKLKIPSKIHSDLEVIKKDQILLRHVSVISIKRRCMLVYGLQDEDPQELLSEFAPMTEDPIYVCRFLASNINGKYHLRGTVVNEEAETSDGDQESMTMNCNSSMDLSPKKFSVVTVDENETIKLRITKISKQHATHKGKDGSEKENCVNNSPDVSTIDQNFKNMLIHASPEHKQFQPVILLEKISNTLTSSESNQSSRTNNKNMTKSNRNSSKPAEVKLARSSKRLSVQYQPHVDESPDESFLDDILNSPPKQARMEATVTPKRKTMDRGTIFEEKTSSSLATAKTINTTDAIRKCKATSSKLIEKAGTPRQKRDKESDIEMTPKNVSKNQRLRLFHHVTPTVKGRDAPMEICDSPMSRARLGLSAHTMPKKMPCRESEYTNIHNFVSIRIKQQSSGCMYISGVPGTGKTMTVCKVMSDLKDHSENYGDFSFLKINALALTEPKQVYVEIVKKLLNKKLHWEEALKQIVSFFKAKKRKIPHVILIDELDKLCTRRQDVVYNLLDLPFHSVTPLIVITIANTMDLPERILANKVNSRLGLVRLTFRPYQYKDLVQIVTERLASDRVFKSEALELVARKVAAVSGDARRALTMCSRATEIAEEEEEHLITMKIVDKVIKEMTNSSKVQAIQCCSKSEQLILTAIANEVSRTGNEEVPFLNMFHNLTKLSILERLTIPSSEILLKLCHNLGSFRLLITQHGRMDIHATLMLNVSTDDIHYALRKN